MKKLSLFILFIMTHCFFAQQLEIIYVIGKKSSTSNAFSSKYVLAIQGEGKSIFVSEDKYLNKKDDFFMIPQFMLVKNGENVSVFDEVREAKISFDLKKEPLKWKITNDKKTENEYPLRKATVVLGGKEWVAWFIENIPVSDGPLMFKGLPGLVYSVENGTQKIVMAKLSKNASSDQVKLEGYKAITEDKYLSLIKVSEDFDNQYFKVMSSMGIDSDVLGKAQKDLDNMDAFKNLFIELFSNKN